MGWEQARGSSLRPLDAASEGLDAPRELPDDIGLEAAVLGVGPFEAVQELVVRQMGPGPRDERGGTLGVDRQALAAHGLSLRSLGP